MPAASQRLRLSLALARILGSTEAASSIEHALFAAIVGIGLLGGLTLTRQAMQSSYRCVASDLSLVAEAACSAKLNGDFALTPAALRAQSLIPSGSRILLGGVFVDRDGNAGYAAQYGPVVAGTSDRSVSLLNTGTGQSVTVQAPVISGVVELASGLLAMIGPGAAALSVPAGMTSVVYLVPDEGGIPRPYYGARAA